MEISTSFIRSEFDRYNSLVFSGALPRVPLRVNSSRRHRGMVKARYVGKAKLPRLPRSLGLRVDPADLEIMELVISDYWEFSPESFRSVLVHEMIHIELFALGIYHTSGGDVSHGREFLRRAEEVSANHGIKISPTDSTGDAPLPSRCKWLDLLLVERTSGNFVMSLFPKGFFDSGHLVVDQLKRRYSRVVCCCSDDPSIQHYPVHRLKSLSCPSKLRFFSIDGHLAGRLLKESARISS